MISINESFSLPNMQSILNIFKLNTSPTSILDPVRRTIQDKELDAEYIAATGISKTIKNTSDIASFWKSPTIATRFKREIMDMSRDMKYLGRKSLAEIKRSFEDDPIKLTAALAIAVGLGYFGHKGLSLLKNNLKKGIK